MSNSDMIES